MKLDTLKHLKEFHWWVKKVRKMEGMNYKPYTEHKISNEYDLGAYLKWTGGSRA